MQCKAAHLLCVLAGIFPQPQRTGNVPAVLFRHHLRNNLWPYPWSYQVQRQAYPLCNGASQLPSPLSQKRLPAYVGQGKGLPYKGIHGNIYGIYHNLVPAEL